ncbi:5-methylcytosine-specific restriction endonuclease system specificity protein McrC [uncultured Desulfosarcina sp.]|uniref:5-methylcytosine-specific restriction endonuclease system specificity protein McrC n=1 Tax=uncultured Desulfosarcina sp. TaxID=218289 RepID=UPI0029C88B49|nr:5-methylcytosine-specific restriction endonuclease system specificity protein McrC [uncultured Desulfosarcina sp.]
MIPIENIYYLLCYAWNHFDEGEMGDIASTEFNNALDLLACVLYRGVSRLLKKGLDRGYVEQEEALGFIHGRIDLNYTVLHGLQHKGRVRCRFDELIHDVLHNRIIKSTIRRLLYAEDLDSSLKEKLRGIYRRLQGIEEIRLKPSVFSDVIFHKNNRYYRFLLHVCELIVSYTMPSEHKGSYRFIDFLSDKKRMWQIFQQFIFNFLVKEQSTYSVKADCLDWPAEAIDQERHDDLKFLPVMYTDISLRSGQRTLIIDTKYYADALKSNRGGNPKVNSANLYQIHTYLSSLEMKDFPDKVAEGLLLYPVNGYQVDLAWKICGHNIRVRTLNLGLDWRSIHKSILEIIDISETYS